jgi:hypothetical protein
LLARARIRPYGVVIGWSSSLAFLDDVWPIFLLFAFRAWWAGPIWKPAVRLAFRRTARRAGLSLQIYKWKTRVPPERSRFRTRLENCWKESCDPCWPFVRLVAVPTFYPQLGGFWASATRDLDSRPRVCYQAFTLLPHVLRSLPSFPTEINATFVERDSFGLNHTGVLEALSERLIWKTMSSRSCSSPSHGF